jgi:hypothetical protein
MTDTFLDRWHQMVAAKDPKQLSDMIADDAILHSPAYFRPKKGKEAILAIFGAVMASVENFQYVGQWVEGNEIVLLFEGQIEGKTLRGIDRVVLDERGLLVEIEVFVRPLSALSALVEEMGRILQGTGQK